MCKRVRSSMNPHEVLKESINFANEQLESFTATKRISDVSTMVITALYRKVIELSDGVNVLAESGLKGPALLSYRGLIEAYLAFSYIIQDETLIEDRAKAYKVGYHKQQLVTAKYPLMATANGERKKRIELATQYHTMQLETDYLHEVSKKYEKLQKQDTRKFPPKWHALDNGLKSINQLTKHVDGQREKYNSSISNLYSLLSTEAHNYMALNDIDIYDDGTISVKAVRSTFDSTKDEYHLIPTMSFLNNATLKFMKSTFRENEENARLFFLRIHSY